MDENEVNSESVSENMLSLDENSSKNEENKTSLDGVTEDISSIDENNSKNEENKTSSDALAEDISLVDENRSKNEENKISLDADTNENASDIDGKCEINETVENNLEKDADATKENENENSVSESNTANEKNVENQVYNMDEEENEENLEIQDEESYERAPKRPMAVITIDDSDSDSSVCHVNSYQATASEAKKLRKGYSSSERSSTPSSSSSGSESDSECEISDIIHTEPSDISKRYVVPKKSLSTTEIKLNECLNEESVNKEFLSRWTKQEPYTNKNITLHNDPFQICIVDDFLDDVDAINNIVDDMNTLNWHRKTMDLYEFHRTNDLCDFTWHRGLKAIYELLNNEVRKWVAQLTDTNLTHISASCALYGPGDHLLIHDDLLDDRKIAFIFYLAPWDLGEEAVDDEDANGSSSERKEKGWTKSMGGSLEFFSCNEKGQPKEVAKSLLPSNNTLAFFKVSDKSFHRVAEVTSFEFPRLTINGWFHGPIDDKQNESSTVETSYTNATLCKPNELVFQNVLSQWISPIYLAPKCINQILQNFEETSEISLVNYFVNNQYEDILKILQNENIPWESSEPVNLRNYRILPRDKINDGDEKTPLKNLIDILTSRHFMNLIQDYTGQKLLSYCKLEIQKWTAGNYTVIPTREEYNVMEIDVALILGSPEKQIKGGILTYLLPEEENSEPIISIGLQNNALNIVLSDIGIAKFTKYISRLSMSDDECYYAIVCSYRNTECNPDDSDNN